MKIAIIIVNYRSAELAIKAIESTLVDSINLAHSQIVVVDNVSGDNSISIINSAIQANDWGQQVTLLSAPKNGGFGYGNNLAIKAVLEKSPDVEAFYLLNPDALLKPKALLNLVTHMQANKRVGFAGSGIYGIDGEQHRTIFRFPSFVSEFSSGLQLGLFFKLFPGSSMTLPIPETDAKVDWLGGASLLIRREVLEDVGYFDEKFFLYFEEIDLIHRAARKGWEAWYVADSAITHIESASTGINDLQKPMPQYWFNSRRYYFLKNHGYFYMQLANISWVLGQSLGSIKNTLLRKKNNSRKRFIRDFIKYSF